MVQLYRSIKTSGRGAYSVYKIRVMRVLRGIRYWLGSIQCGNKTHFRSKATDIMNTPTLPMEMRGCHKFDDAAMAQPLFAVEKVTEAKGSVYFFPELVVLCDKDAKVMLTGLHQPNHRRHVIPIDGTSHHKSPRP